MTSVQLNKLDDAAGNKLNRHSTMELSQSRLMKSALEDGECVCVRWVGGSYTVITIRETKPRLIPSTLFRYMLLIQNNLYKG